MYVVMGAILPLTEVAQVMHFGNRVFGGVTVGGSAGIGV
jgi:hypothetical protein